MNVVGPVLTGTAVVFVAWMLKRSFQGFIDDRIGAVENSVGTPNGNGNLVQMTEQLLAWQEEQIRWQEKHDQQDERRFKAVHKRLDNLENPEKKR